MLTGSNYPRQPKAWFGVVLKLVWTCDKLGFGSSSGRLNYLTSLPAAGPESSAMLALSPQT